MEKASAGRSRLRNPQTKPGRVVDRPLTGTVARVSRPAWCYCHITIPSWGNNMHLRVSNPDRFPRCMFAESCPPCEEEA